MSVFGVDQCSYVCQCAGEHAMVAMGYTDGGSEPYGGPDYIGKCPHFTSLLTLVPSVPGYSLSKH